MRRHELRRPSPSVAGRSVRYSAETGSGTGPLRAALPVHPRLPDVAGALTGDALLDAICDYVNAAIENRLGRKYVPDERAV